jgi:2-polyprenyl-6-methoxyphenol hydroxylase-like FAD-dependent oxidoreductase
MNTQIQVVGAGPVGLRLAFALRRQDLAVRIVDKSAARTNKSKAVVIWPRTLELLDIQGCAPALVGPGVPVRGARILGEGRELVHARFDPAGPHERHGRRWRFGPTLD